MLAIRSLRNLQEIGRYAPKYRVHRKFADFQQEASLLILFSLASSRRLRLPTWESVRIFYTGEVRICLLPILFLSHGQHEIACQFLLFCWILSSVNKKYFICSYVYRLEMLEIRKLRNNCSRSCSSARQLSEAYNSVGAVTCATCFCCPAWRFGPLLRLVLRLVRQLESVLQVSSPGSLASSSVINIY